MAWHRPGTDPVQFPTPWRTRDVCYPNFYRSCRPSPGFPRYGHDLGVIDDDWRGEKGIAALIDRKLEGSGDLGWSLDYATAWCYRHLVGNQPAVVDAIDNVRELDIEAATPFFIFEHLDTALFGSKLRGMVCLSCRQESSCSPGTTSAPGVIGIPRICIQLNSTPLIDDDTEIDDLLEALVHHMIHAYFLVCCGAQKKGEKQDGRLMDGTHFGVILMTIRDITKSCEEGVLPLMFHASKRKDLENGALVRSLMAPNHPPHPFNHAALPYISIDPRGCGVGPALADGQTHCLHDNRIISYQQIKNWQVTEYSRALDTEMDLQGDEVFEYEPDGKLTAVHRLKAPPSVTYAELLWDEKHVMVPREKALRLKSIEWPLKKYGRYVLEIPPCDGITFTCIYDFINKGCYPGSEAIVWDPHTTRQILIPRGRSGPPVLVAAAHVEARHPGVIKHLRIFKLAEKLKFEELIHYALARLWEMPRSTDDPIESLRELYDDNHDPAGPIHSELHRWSRAFLLQTDESLRGLFRGRGRGGASNLSKIQRAYPHEFRALCRRSRAFQDDVKIASAELVMRGRGGWEGLSSRMGEGSSLPVLGMGSPPAALPGLDDLGAGLFDAGSLGGGMATPLAGLAALGMGPSVSVEDLLPPWQQAEDDELLTAATSLPAWHWAQTI